jgi:hypothetical protein
MIARSHLDLHNIRSSVERIGNLTDNVFHFGPVKLGLEAVLEWVPFVGEAYSLVAGGLLLVEGVRARVPSSTLMSVSSIVAIRTVIGAGDFIPVVGQIGNLAASLFAGHKIASNLIIKAMEETVYIEGRRADARHDPEVAEILARIKAGREKRRVVFLG